MGEAEGREAKGGVKEGRGKERCDVRRGWDDDGREDRRWVEREVGERKRGVGGGGGGNEGIRNGGEGGGKRKGVRWKE